MFNHCCKLTSTPFTWTTSSLHGTKYKLTVSLLKKWMIGWPWTYSWSWLYVLYWLSPNPDHMVTQIAALDWLFKSGYITEPRDSSPRLTLYHPTCILACDAAQLKTFLSTPQTQACSNHRTLVNSVPSAWTMYISLFTLSMSLVIISSGMPSWLSGLDQVSLLKTLKESHPLSFTTLSPSTIIHTLMPVSSATSSVPGQQRAHFFQDDSESPASIVAPGLCQ